MIAMKTVFSLILIVFSAIGAVAQAHDVRRTEVFGGYAFESANTDFGRVPSAPNVFRERKGHHGFEGSVVVNFSRYFGVKADVSGTYKSGLFVFKNVPTGFLSPATTTSSLNGKSSLYNFLGGVQVKDNSSSGRVRPFAHAMLGAAHRNDNIEGRPCISVCPISTQETGFAAAFGGGLDVRIKGRLGIRLIQVDYNPIKFTGGMDNNFRFSTGLLF
jgi:hypothetical protein